MERYVCLEPENVRPTNVSAAPVEQQPQLNTRASPATVRAGLTSRLPVGGTAAKVNKIKLRGVVRRPAAKVRARSGVIPDDKYANLHDLRVILGLETSEKSAEWTNTVFVSLDCEWERRGLIKHIVEIGVSTLAVRDIAGLDPKDYLEGWMPHMEHHHFVIDTARHLHSRMHSSLFANSKLLSLRQAYEELVQILRRCATTDPQSDLPEAKLILLGQSIEGDVSVLRRQPPHKLDLMDPTSSGVTFAYVMDTHLNTRHLQRRRKVIIATARLGEVAKWLGVHPKYWDGSTLRGVHNAVNDAAYTLMALLLQGLKLPDLISGRHSELRGDLTKDDLQVLRSQLRESSRERQRDKMKARWAAERASENRSLLKFSLGLAALVAGGVLIQTGGRRITRVEASGDEIEVD
ncbi:hypothetical protein Tdes44962_MAKER00146 [Teratosphaeria destructans]|uniref:Gfd2/YDR514C-like C-terminal domain-containing protein n=1 Tax=Teratosphaeria destructans TaxID=418781 RepID=A0A9W7T3D5_9PEZI|nr:hypothetical protein Tdes44962_MAKER00146 [Teratosphaeria destructans]